MYLLYTSKASMFQDLSDIRGNLGIKSQIEKFQDEYYNAIAKCHIQALF